ncbi:MAG TPA: ABC transporter ATP-binding protein [Bacillota bacterium]|nr:ABC transporter ATP-binding protein [Bacillota bacterium]
MAMPAEKARDFKGALKRLAGYLKPCKNQIAAVVLMAVAGTVFSTVSPKILGKATTRLFEGLMMKLNHVPGARVDFQYIWQILLIVGAFYVLSAFFHYVQQYIMAAVAQKTVFDLRRHVGEKLARLPLKYFDSHAHGEILSRVTNDIDNIGGTLQQSVTQLITAAVTLAGIIVMMLTISPLMTLICAVTLPLSLAVTKGVVSCSQQYFREQWEELGKLNGHVEEMYTGHQVVKAFGHERDSINRFENINEKLYQASWKSQFVSGVIMPLMTFINNLGYVSVCVAGGILVARKAVEIGDVQAFIQYARQFTWPITQAANIANIIQSTVASAERVFELLDEDEEIPDKADAKVIDFPGGGVKFQNVRFGYKEDAILIENMNIDVEPGQTVAVVGPTGAGKTTLVNLLMRFYETGGGRITVDGVDIRDLKRGRLRRIFGMVLQDTWLFNGAIRDNIAYGREGASFEEIVRAAKAAHADHFIRTLPRGYDTVLNEEASNISEGQKQLLTIARAILADPAILILDEATSSVDTRTEAAVQKAMANLMKGRTSFVIAHRLSTIRDADLILVMNNGSIVEKGRHDELLAAGGFYAELYCSQFAGECPGNPAVS